MNITSDKPYMIFVKEHNGKKYYKVGLSKKSKTEHMKTDMSTFNLNKE